MQRYKVTLGQVLFCCCLLSHEVLAVENANETSNAVTAYSNQRRAFKDQTLISEKHRHKQEKNQPVTKYLEKKASTVSYEAHTQISKVVVTGNKNIHTGIIRSIIIPYLSRGVTKQEADQISTDIENYYRKQGYFLPVAHIDIAGSIMKVKIIEGKIKSILIGFADPKRDKKVLKNKRFLDLIKKIEDANPTRTKDLEKYLILINKIHGYKVDYQLKQLDNIEGNEVAELVMQVETKKGSASASIDNAGTKDLGKHQLHLSAQAYNVISNDAVMLTFGTSEKPKKFQTITAGYLKRLNSYGTSASIFGSHLKSDPYNSSGSKYNISKIIKARLDQYIILNNDHSFKLEVSAENRDVTNYSRDVKTSDYKYLMGSIGGKIKVTDPLEVANWFFPYFHGALNKVSYKENSTEARNFDRDFSYFAVDWYRNQPLPRDFSLFLKASYQYTDKLLPKEHIYSINSSNTARGYESGLVSNDKGISGKAELRYTKEFQKDRIRKFIQTAQIFGFYDVTHFIDHNKTEQRTKHPNAIYFNKSTFPAFGGGLRLFFPYEFFAEGTIEIPTIKKVNVNGATNKNKTIYRFMLSKEFDW